MFDFGKKKLTKEEQLVRDLTELVRDRIAKNWNHMGIRSETDSLDQGTRSKAVRAYIVDLFGNYDQVAGLHELEEAIRDSINLFYEK